MRDSKGFTLIELVIVIALLCLAIGGGMKACSKTPAAVAAVPAPAVNPCDENNMPRYSGTVTTVQYVAVGPGQRYNIPLWFASVKKDDGTAVSAMLPGIVKEGEKVCIARSPNWDNCTDMPVVCP